MSDYNNFLKTVLPTVLGLSSSTTELDRWTYLQRRSDPLERVVSAHYGLSDVRNDYFDVVADYELTVSVIDAAATTRRLLRIACKFEGHFHAAAPVDKGNAQQFTERDSWLIFWPYFRQFVSDLTARMSIRAEVLPLHLGPGTFTRRTPFPKTVETKALPVKNKKATKSAKT